MNKNLLLEQLTQPGVTEAFCEIRNGRAYLYADKIFGFYRFSNLDLSISNSVIIDMKKSRRVMLNRTKNTFRGQSGVNDIYEVYLMNTIPDNPWFKDIPIFLARGSQTTNTADHQYRADEMVEKCKSMEFPINFFEATKDQIGNNISSHSYYRYVIQNLCVWLNDMLVAPPPNETLEIIHVQKSIVKHTAPRPTAAPARLVIFAFDNVVIHEAMKISLFFAKIKHLYFFSILGFNPAPRVVENGTAGVAAAMKDEVKYGRYETFVSTDPINLPTIQAFFSMISMKGRMAANLGRLDVARHQYEVDPMNEGVYFKLLQKNHDLQNKYLEMESPKQMPPATLYFASWIQSNVENEDPLIYVCSA